MHEVRHVQAGRGLVELRDMSGTSQEETEAPDVAVDSTGVYAFSGIDDRIFMFLPGMTGTVSKNHDIIEWADGALWKKRM